MKELQFFGSECNFMILYTCGWLRKVLWNLNCQVFGASSGKLYTHRKLRRWEIFTIHYKSCSCKERMRSIPSSVNLDAKENPCQPSAGTEIINVLCLCPPSASSVISGHPLWGERRREWIQTQNEAFPCLLFKLLYKGGVVVGTNVPHLLWMVIFTKINIDLLTRK